MPNLAVHKPVALPATFKGIVPNVKMQDQFLQSSSGYLAAPDQINETFVQFRALSFWLLEYCSLSG